MLLPLVVSPALFISTKQFTTMITDQWKNAKADVFWGEIAPCDHVIQVYENDEVFLDTLAGFVGAGINASDCVIVIATENHLESLYNRLSNYSINIQNLIEDDRYIPLDADEVLDRFMVDGWPNEEFFNSTISALIEKGTKRGRNIRAFGEMVALLWGKGQKGATVQLEELWNNFCSKNKMSLFCAYPTAGFTDNIISSVQNLCACHTKIIDGVKSQITEIYYTELEERKAS